MKKLSKRSVITAIISIITALIVATIIAIFIESKVGAPKDRDAAVIVTVQTSGGMCADGPCGGSTLLYSDGRFGSKTINKETVTAIEHAINESKWSNYPEKEYPACESFVDGSDISYIFPNDEKLYTTCLIDIPKDDPLFTALQKLYSQ